jgi:Transposase, Mutator family
LIVRAGPSYKLRTSRSGQRDQPTPESAFGFAGILTMSPTVLVGIVQYFLRFLGEAAISVEARAASDRGGEVTAGSVGGCDRSQTRGKRQSGVPLAKAVSRGRAGVGARRGATGAGADQRVGEWGAGATENATVVGELLGDLVNRGLNFSEPRLYILDGGKALTATVKKHAGESAAIQRCQVHKRRNVLDHLTDEQKPVVA